MCNLISSSQQTYEKEPHEAKREKGDRPKGTCKWQNLSLGLWPTDELGTTVLHWLHSEGVTAQVMVSDSFSYSSQCTFGFRYPTSFLYSGRHLGVEEKRRPLSLSFYYSVYRILVKSLPICYSHTLPEAKLRIESILPGAFESPRSILGHQAWGEKSGGVEWLTASPRPAALSFSTPSEPCQGLVSALDSPVLSELKVSNTKIERCQSSVTRNWVIWRWMYQLLLPTHVFLEYLWCRSSPSPNIVDTCICKLQ